MVLGAKCRKEKGIGVCKIVLHKMAATSGGERELHKKKVRERELNMCNPIQSLTLSKIKLSASMGFQTPYVPSISDII